MSFSGVVKTKASDLDRLQLRTDVHVVSHLGCSCAAESTVLRERGSKRHIVLLSTSTSPSSHHTRSKQSVVAALAKAKSQSI